MRRVALLAAMLSACGSASPPPGAAYSFPGCPPASGAELGTCPDNLTFACAEGHLDAHFAGPCASDADCTWAPVTGTCYADCGVAVALAHQSDFETAIHLELDKFCAGAQCGAVVTCGPTPVMCSSGICVTAPLAGGFDAGCGPPAPSSFCSTTTCYGSWPEVMAACDPGLQLSACGGFDVAVQSGLDQSGTGYFDPDSGALLAVVLGGSGNVGCHGPPGFVAPTDCSADAGALAIACDAGM